MQRRRAAAEQSTHTHRVLPPAGVQSKALFAAKCLVEAVVQMYRAGYTLDDVKLSISLGGEAQLPTMEGYSATAQTRLHLMLTDARQLVE